jgi:predicted O-methyltransferase YrrM
MIEASIVGRPVLSVLVPEFHDSQLATFHFSYLLHSDGGPVQLAQSMDEHLGDLGAALVAPDDEAPEHARRFVADFVRPQGLERPATDVFVETIEQLARTSVEPERDPAWIVPIRFFIVLPVWLRLVAKRARKRRPRLRRALQKHRLRVRRALQKRRRHLVERAPPAVLWSGRRVLSALATARRLRKRLGKTIRKRWRVHGRPVLSRVLKQPDRVRMWRTGALGPLNQFTRRQPPGAFGPDYSDLHFLYQLLRERRPETVLEFGSGCSTAVIATALRDNRRGHLWSVDGDADWARATEEALPEGLRAFVTVVHSPVLEDDRDVLGWRYEHVPEIDPDFVYLDGPGHTRERKVAFDVLDIESRFRPGFVLVVDGRGRNAHYLRDNLAGTYRFVEYRMRWRAMFRFLFELVDTERTDSLDVDLRASDASVGS